MSIYYIHTIILALTLTLDLIGVTRVTYVARCGSWRGAVAGVVRVL